MSQGGAGQPRRFPPPRSASGAGEGLPTLWQEVFRPPWRVEEGACFQHGAGDIEEAVGDRSQGAAMAVTATSEHGVFGSALWVNLHRDARPMVRGIGEPIIAGLSSDDNAAFARTLGNWRDSCQTAQGGVVASLQGIEGFCEQRGEDDPSHSWRGCEDLHVMLLFLPRLGLFGGNEAGGQGIEPAMGFFELPVDEADARNERGDMGAGALRSSRQRR